MKEYYLEMLKLIPGWLIPFAAGFALMFFKIVHPAYGSIFVYAVLYAAIYVLSVWFISLSDSEKGYIKGLITKFAKAEKIK